MSVKRWSKVGRDGRSGRGGGRGYGGRNGGRGGGAGAKCERSTNVGKCGSDLVPGKKGEEAEN